MWTSVPQIVVVVMRISASSGPDIGDRLVVEHDPAGLDEDGGFHHGHGVTPKEAQRA